CSPRCARTSCHPSVSWRSTRTSTTRSSRACSRRGCSSSWGGDMPFIGRAAALRRLRKRVAAGSPIVGAGAGTGISAKFAERGGVDLIIIYNSGRFRMAGRGSLAGLLPYGDANAIVQDMAKEVLPVVRDTPGLAGVCGTDPFRIIPCLLRDLKAMGFDGIQNFPTVGLIDGIFRQNREETGMRCDLEGE